MYGYHRVCLFFFFLDLPFAIFTTSISIHLKNVALIDSLHYLQCDYDNLNYYYNYLTCCCRRD